MAEEKKQNLTEEEEPSPSGGPPGETLGGNEKEPATGESPPGGEAEAATADPAPESAGESVPQAPSLEDELQAARDESKEHYDRYLRAVADMENFRRRSLREKEEARRYAAGALAEDLLPVLDNFELGLESARSHPEASGITQGFEMVYQQLKTILREHGIEEIDPGGESFDPHRHESTGTEPDDNVPEGKVLKVVRRGYALNGRLLRPAMVLLSAGAAGEADSAQTASGEPEAAGDEPSREE